MQTTYEFRGEAYSDIEEFYLALATAHIRRGVSVATAETDADAFDDRTDREMASLAFSSLLMDYPELADEGVNENDSVSRGEMIDAFRRLRATI